MFRGITAAVAAAFVIMAGAASAELATWEQERVTKYAKDLVTASNDLEKALNQIGIQNFAQQNAMYKLKDTVDMLHTASRGLAKALEKGEGREATLPRFKRISTLRRDAQVEAQGADIQESVFAKIFPVGEALISLRPYYQEEPLEWEKKAGQ